MKMRILVILLLAAMLVADSGCCSIMCGDEKTVNIDSNPKGAEFEIMNPLGDIIVKGITPTNTTLKRGRGWFLAGDYKITFHKVGYEDITVPIKQGLETFWYFGGNFVFGGLLGIIIIDPATGAMYTIEDVNVALIPKSVVQTPEGPKKVIGYRIDTSRKDAAGNFLKVPVLENEEQK